jgi:lambda family phage portal protein
METRLNWLDRAITFFAPRAGLQRARYRAATDVLRAYDGARTGRRFDGWLTSGSDANTALGPDLQKLRDRSRDLTRNTPQGSRLRGLIAGGAVGTGIFPFADTGDEGLDKLIDDVFARHTKECDADGELDYWGLQRLVADAMFESGAAVIRRRQRRPGDGFYVGLQYQVMEPDLIDLSGVTSNSGGVTIQGIEFDAIGAKVGYWMFPRHPGATGTIRMNTTLASKLVPATEIAHVYRKTRPGQVHGVPALSAVITLLRDMAEYGEAEIVRAKIAACLSLFVTQPTDAATVGKATTEDETGARLESMRPGLILYGRPGEQAEAVVPTGHANFTDYMKFEQHLLAVGVDAFYAQLSGDLGSVNWSSFRAGDRDYRAAIDALRWLYLIPMGFEVMWRWFIDAAWLAGRIPVQNHGVRWTPPQFQSIDPVKDAEADEGEMANGTLLFPDACARKGLDPERHLVRMVEWQKKLDAAGVVLAWDRRKVTATGKAAGEAPKL